MTNECGYGLDFSVGDIASISFDIGDDTTELNLEVGNALIMSDVFPTYSGPYEVTPSPEIQVLSTRNRVLVDRITIAPIPQNYGLVTYNGSSITVS